MDSNAAFDPNSKAQTKSATLSRDSSPTNSRSVKQSLLGTDTGSGSHNSPANIGTATSKYDQSLSPTSQQKEDASKRRFVYLCTILSCLSSILLGYDIGVMSGAIIFMERDLALSTWDEEIILSSLNLFATFGALIGGHLAHMLGRRTTILISAIVFLIGALVCAATKIIAVIILGRILLGLGTGTGLLIAPLYSAELSPAHIRGKLVTFAEISINAGILFGYFVAWALRDLSDDMAWRTMVALGAIPALILICGLVVMPESPRWLVERGKLDKARIVLAKIAPLSEVESRIQEIQTSIQLESTQVHASWSQVMCCCFSDTSPVLKRALIIGIGVAFFQQATGNEAAVYWTPKVFQQVGLSENWVLLGTVFVGLAKCLFILVATFFLDKVGRRPMLLASAIIMTLCLAGLAINFAVGRPPIMTIALQCAFCGAFSIGWGPITWVITSEIFPLVIRSRAMAVCTVVNRLLSGLVALTFLSLQDALSPQGTWWMYTGISCISVVFVFFMVPETKGKTLEEITAFLVRGSIHFHLDEEEEDLPPQVIQDAVDVSMGLGPTSVEKRKSTLASEVTSNLELVSAK